MHFDEIICALCGLFRLPLFVAGYRGGIRSSSSSIGSGTVHGSGSVVYKFLAFTDRLDGNISNHSKKSFETAFNHISNLFWIDVYCDVLTSYRFMPGQVRIIEGGESGRPETLALIGQL